MDTKELKNKILNNTLDDSVLVMKYSDNKFLCNLIFTPPFQV